MSLPLALGAAYGTLELVLSRLHRSRGRSGADRGSLRLLWACALGGVVVASFAPAWITAGGYELGTAGLAAALLVFATGLALRAWSIRVLGRWFTVDVATSDDHELVARGPYAFVRHPSYTGVLLCFAGWAATFEHAVSAAAVFAPFACALLYRIHVEERVLAQRFGPEWAAYAARTKRLVPGVW